MHICVQSKQDIKPSARDAWSKGFQDALKELEQEAIWKSAKGGVISNFFANLGETLNLT